MGTQTVAQIFESVNDVELCPDVAIRDMQWYWGHDMLTGLNQWFWVGPEVNPADMPNYLSDERPVPKLGPVYPNDTRQGCSYDLDRSL